MASHPTAKLFEAVLELDVELQEALVQALLARLADRRAPAGVTAAWKRYGYDVIDLPLASVEKRLAVLSSALQPAA